MSVLERVREYVPLPTLDEVARYVGSFTNLESGLNDLKLAEEAFARSRNEFSKLIERGLATADDYATYNVNRANLFTAQMQWWIVVTQALGSIPLGSRFIEDIPVPVPAPDMPGAPRRAGATGLKTVPSGGKVPVAIPTGGVAGVGGIGLPALVAGGSLTAAGWAAVVLGVLAVAGILYWALSDTEDAVVADAAARAGSEVFEAACRARVEAYQACLSAGGTPQACGAQSETLIPDPLVSADTAQKNVLKAGEQDKYKWIVWTLAGVGGLTALVLFLRSDVGRAARGRAAREIERRGVAGLGGPTRVNDLDGPSNYHLEIES